MFSYSLEIVKKSVLFLKTTDNGLTEIVKITIDSFAKETLMNQVKMLAPGWSTRIISKIIDVFEVILDVVQWMFLMKIGWMEEQKKFCRSCLTYHDTIEAAKSACEQDISCNAVYDLFCDGIGSFCNCRYAIDQIHPHGIDCAHIYDR